MTSLRDLARAAWLVRDDGQLKFSAENWVGYLDTTDDTLAPAGPITDRKIPRTGAIAVIAFHASERLGLEWKAASTHATAMRGGKVVAIVDQPKQDYRIRITSEWWSPLLHLAVMHGVTLVRGEAARSAVRRRGK